MNSAATWCGQPLERLVSRLGLDLAREGECVVWTGARNRSGYGVFRIQGRNYLTHRVSYRGRVGVIPQGLCVLHRCDNRVCVRPDHLFLGTRADNMRDMGAKGRASQGEAHYNAVLDAKCVREILTRVASGELLSEVAADLGVKYGTAYAVVRGRSWVREGRAWLQEHPQHDGFFRNRRRRA